MVTIEQWLRTAVEQLDRIVFEGELNLVEHKYQIYFGRVKGKKGSECVQPSDAENITLDDFFPTTIGLDYQIKDVEQLLTTLTYECIKAFYGVTKGKPFKKLAERFNFEKPFTEPNPSPYLRDQIRDVLHEVEQRVGKFPGKAVKFPVKEAKERKSTKVTFFCPECGLEYVVSKKQLKNNLNQGCPTCICGAKCGIDLEDDTAETETGSENKN